MPVTAERPEPAYVALARWFVTEGADTVFTLMGDGNMHWATTIAADPSVQMVYVRHEHCAVAMAMGYTSATGKVGIASVTCGPGVTQIVTALGTAVRSRIPMVVFVGETPLSSKWDAQRIEQRPLMEGTGAAYLSAHSLAGLPERVREAFVIARTQRRPAVIGVPYDLQELPMPEVGDYVASAALIALPALVVPRPDQIAALAKRLSTARSPILLAGRGAIAASAAPAIRELADRTGALLGTSMQARGLFDDHRYSLGVLGGWARMASRDIAQQADLVIAFGASLTTHTLDNGTLLPHAHLVQVDLDPGTPHDGRISADELLLGDARLVAEGLLAAAPAAPTSTVRTPEVAERIATEPADDAPAAIAPGTVDPRRVVDALDVLIPKSWDTVSGTGHNSYFHTVMRGRAPEHYHFIRGFGAIGNGLSIATGVAVARGDGRTVLFDGDGGVIMHAQEFETIRRHGIRLLVCVFNDGAYGSEFHKLKAYGLPTTGADLGAPDFASIARGFGLRGATVTDVAQLPALFAAYAAQEVAEVWDIRVSDQVLDPLMRRRVGTITDDAH